MRSLLTLVLVRLELLALVSIAVQSVVDLFKRVLNTCTSFMKVTSTHTAFCEMFFDNFYGGGVSKVTWKLGY